MPNLHCTDCDTTFTPATEHEDIELLIFVFSGEQLAINHPQKCPECEGCLNLEVAWSGS